MAVSGVARLKRETEDRPLKYLDQIHNPIALATKYLASRRLLGGRDEDDLMDVAIEAIVNAALAWDPNGGGSIMSWAYLYLDRDVTRAIGRAGRERSELGSERCVSDDDGWLQYDHGTDDYVRVEQRVDLRRWADLAELTDAQRFIVQYAAYHQGVYVRDTPLADRRSPLHGSGHPTLRNALNHMRRAATTNERRDDRWTKMRRNGTAGHLECKQAEALRKWRDELARPLVQPRETTRDECAEDGCERPAESWGLCDTHYRRARKAALEQKAS